MYPPIPSDLIGELQFNDERWVNYLLRGGAEGGGGGGGYSLKRPIRGDSVRKGYFCLAYERVGISLLDLVYVHTLFKGSH